MAPTIAVLLSSRALATGSALVRRLAAGLLVVLIIAGCTKTHDVSGQISIPQGGALDPYGFTTAEDGTCTGKILLAAFESGGSLPVDNDAVESNKRKVLATMALGASKASDNGLLCTFDFTISKLPQSDGYAVRFGGGDSVTFSPENSDGDWTITLIVR